MVGGVTIKLQLGEGPALSTGGGGGLLSRRLPRGVVGPVSGQTHLTRLGVGTDNSVRDLVRFIVSGVGDLVSVLASFLLAKELILDAQDKMLPSGRRRTTSGGVLGACELYNSNTKYGISY